LRRRKGFRRNHCENVREARISLAGVHQNWLKIKARPQQEFVVCGFTEGKGSRFKNFGALLFSWVSRRPSSAISGILEADLAKKDYRRQWSD